MELLTLLLKIEENTHCVTKHRGNSSFLLLNIEGVTHVVTKYKGNYSPAVSLGFSPRCTKKCRYIEI